MVLDAVIAHLVAEIGDEAQCSFLVGHNPQVEAMLVFSSILDEAS
jgi:phosphohistidine phosphatase SixA